MKRIRPSIGVLALFLTHHFAITAGAQMHDADFPAIARVIVDRIDPRAGERVLLMAVAGVADPLVAPLRAELARRGAIDLGALASQGDPLAGWETAFTRGAKGLSGDALTRYLATVDAAVMLPGATPPQDAYLAMQRVLQSGHGRTVHFHWAGAYGMDGVLQSVTPPRAALYQRVLRETNYAALSAAQLRVEAAMRGATIRVTTPAGTDVSFRIADRPVTRQDGDASAARATRARNLIDREVELPAGAIRVAPDEPSVNGTVVFPPSVWGGERVGPVTMRFARGRLTGFDVTEGRAAVERELATGGEAARSFREFALGLNPLLAIPAGAERWIPYYGYGAGVVRLSLGDNTELGGNVGGGYVRWNFFVDATVTIGDAIWVEGGRLVR